MYAFSLSLSVSPSLHIMCIMLSSCSVQIGTRLARKMWRKAMNYATCPACRGVGNYTMKAAVLFRRLVRGENYSEDMKKPKRGGKWMLPDSIVQFISNIPKSALSLRPYRLSWCVNRIWCLFQQKLLADTADTQAGYPLQAFDQFIVEAYLQATESRFEAEMGLFRLFMTVKEHYRKHPLLHTFVRFLSILQLDDVNNSSTNSAAVAASHSRRKSSGPAKKMSSSKANLEQALDEMLKPTSRELPLSVLTVYMYARKELLKDNYAGVYAAAIARAKTYEGNASAGGNLMSNQRVVETASDKKKHISALSSATHLVKEGHCYDDVDPIDTGKHWRIHVPPHVCVFSDMQIWVPLDRAVNVMRTVMTFLTDDQLLAVCRRIEHISAFLGYSGVLTSAEGNHSEIRQHMRIFLRHGPLKESMSPEVISDFQALSQGDANRVYTVVVNMDEALQT